MTPSLQMSNRGNFSHPQQQYPPIMCRFYPPLPRLISIPNYLPTQIIFWKTLKPVTCLITLIISTLTFYSHSSTFLIHTVRTPNLSFPTLLSQNSPPIWHQNFESYGMRLNNALHVWSSVVQDSPSNHDQNSQSLTVSAVTNTCKVENVNPIPLPACKNETSVHFTYSSAQGGHNNS